MNLKQKLIESIINDNLEEFIMNNEIPNINYKKLLLVLGEIGLDIISKTNDVTKLEEFFDGFEVFASSNVVVSNYIGAQTGEFDEVKTVISNYYQENYHYQESTMGNEKAKVKVLSNGLSTLPVEQSNIIPFNSKEYEMAGFIGPLLLALSAAVIEVATVLYIIMK